MQFSNHVGSKMQFYKQNMHLNVCCAWWRTYMQKSDNVREIIQCSKKNWKIKPKLTDQKIKLQIRKATGTKNAIYQGKIIVLN